MLEKHHIIYEPEWDLTQRTENSSSINSTSPTQQRPHQVHLVHERYEKISVRCYTEFVFVGKLQFTVQEQGSLFHLASGGQPTIIALLNLTPASKSNQCFIGSVKLDCPVNLHSSVSCHQLLYILKYMQFSNEIHLYKLTSLGLPLIMIISLMVSAIIKQHQWEPFWVFWGGGLSQLHYSELILFCSFSLVP